MSSPRLFTRPAPAVAMALVALNDHVLKGSGLLPGLLTGKLSDVLGLYFAPLLLAELWGLAAPRTSPRANLGRVGLCALTLGALFCAIKLSPAASALYAQVLSLGPGRARNVVDPSDLLALPALGLALWDARRVLGLAFPPAAKPSPLSPGRGPG